jgi:1-acyl-sn-glycerol-3-phosphate acyltransferase
MDDGWNLLLYPEGTRSRTGEMAPFKPGACLLAKKTGRPVIPVHVVGGADILPCGRFMPQPGHAFVRYGGPMWPETGETTAAFADRLEQRVRAMGATKRAAAAAAESKLVGRGRLASARAADGRY